MKIAVIGWGSLIWHPKDLKLKNAEWFEDGPELPIEFSRISNDGRLTLVLRPDSSKVRTLWNYMDYDNLEKARKNLQQREEVEDINRIGFMDVKNGEKQIKHKSLYQDLHKWAKSKNIDAVIWTDLSVRFKDKINKDLNIENIIEYLNCLGEDEKERAKNYILNTPSQVQTDFRKQIETYFKWRENNRTI